MQDYNNLRNLLGYFLHVIHRLAYNVCMEKNIRGGASPYRDNVIGRASSGMDRNQPAKTGHRGSACLLAHAAYTHLNCSPL